MLTMQRAQPQRTPGLAFGLVPARPDAAVVRPQGVGFMEQATANVLGTLTSSLTQLASTGAGVYFKLEEQKQKEKELKLAQRQADLLAEQMRLQQQLAAAEDAAGSQRGTLLAAQSAVGGMSTGTMLMIGGGALVLLLFVLKR